jgi:hypothetical protein
LSKGGTYMGNRKRARWYEFRKPKKKKGRKRRRRNG